MWCPIELNHQPTFRTIKVDNVRTYATLSTKFLTQDFAVLKIWPKHCFSGSSGLSESFAGFVCFSSIEESGPARFVHAFTKLGRCRTDHPGLSATPPLRGGECFKT